MAFKAVILHGFSLRSFCRRYRRFLGSSRRQSGVLLQNREQHLFQCRFICGGCSSVMALGLRMLGIEQDGAGDKLRFAPPLLLQKLRYRPLLGVLQIELQGEPARLFLLAHAGHMLLWAI